jgi:hypothetical protein
MMAGSRQHETVGAAACAAGRHSRGAILLPGALLLSILLTAGCATTQELPLDASSDLQVIVRVDRHSGTREWLTQRRYVEGGPVMPLGHPAFAVDVIGWEDAAGSTSPVRTSGFQLRLHSINWGWQFLRNREIELWLDGTEQIALGEGEYSGGLRADDQRRGNFHQEVLLAPILRAELERVTEAGRVDVLVGEHRFTLHPSSIEVIRRLLAAVPPNVR